MMVKKNTHSIADSQEMEMLLPWYVSGNLEPEQREQLERYLAEHPDAAVRIENIKDEKEATLDGNDAIEGPSEDILERFLARIDADEQLDTVPARSGMFEWFKSYLPIFEMPVARLAAAAITLVLIAQATIIGILMTGHNDGPTYETASASKSTTANNEPRLLIAFTDQATAGEIAKLMNEIAGNIVSGPKAGGFYTVRVSGRTPVSINMEEIITILRKRTRLIRFVATAK